MLTKLLLLLALTLGLAEVQAQTPKQLYDARAFRGNLYSYPVIDIPLDDTLSYSSTLYYSRLGAALPTALQPVTTKTPGLLQVKINNTSLLPALAWLEIKGSGQTRYTANVYSDKSGRAQLSLTPDQPYIDIWKGLMTYNDTDPYGWLWESIQYYNY